MLSPIILVPAILNGLLTGAVYALVALGLTLIYGVLHIINFAHGALLTCALFAAFFCYQLLGLDPYLAVLGLTPLFFCLGYALQRFVIGPAAHGEDHNILLVTLGLAVVIENALLYAFRADTRTINLSYGFNVVEVGPAFLSLPRVIGFGIVIAVALALWLLMRFTDTGKAIRAIALVAALLGCVPLLTSSNVVLNFMVVALLIALVGQGWNVLGGYGGQYSFGHAAFFGTGAYVTAILQVHYGVNAWFGLVIGVAAGALVGAVIGALSFRSGLRGSYFALVTLAFAEVLRIIASVAPITGAGVGTLVKLDMRWEAFQFQSRAPFYWIILAFVAVSLLIAQRLEASRFGAYLVALRENGDAAQASGIDVFRVKLRALTLSTPVTAAAGCFYAQYFLFLDAGIAYGPWISVEVLLAPVIGGIGTVFGPLLGALVVKTLGEITKLATGDAPGLDLVIYGCVLILVVAFAPRGIAGLLRRRA